MKPSLVALIALVLLGSAQPAPVCAAPPVTRALAGSVGGYAEGVTSVAMGIESSGRIHVLWTGSLNEAFGSFAYYASSTDGANWTPFQILNYYDAYDPQVVVDDAHMQVHLVYRSNVDGILHHTVTNGVVSAPHTVGTGISPRLAVDPASGLLYAVWQSIYSYQIDALATGYRYRAAYAYWQDGSWHSPVQPINDGDTFYVSVAAAPGGRAMLAWFQDWSLAQGGPADAGLQIVPRTAYGASPRTPARFPLRQAVSGLYPAPEKDSSILLTYSPGDDQFYMFCNHLMWPGHSRAYRYTWKGAWSAALDVSASSTGWNVPVFLGAAPGSPGVYYVWRTDSGELWARTESGGALGAAQNLTGYLAGRGYAGTPAFFVGRGGVMHMVVAGTFNGAGGLWYLHQ